MKKVLTFGAVGVFGLVAAVGPIHHDTKKYPLFWPNLQNCKQLLNMNYLKLLSAPEVTRNHAYICELWDAQYPYDA